ncbi:MAG: hypothetical protein V3T86_04500 [Planctomycetota bacterium]
MRAFLATRKGLFLLNRRRDGWHLDEPRFLGVNVTAALWDTRDNAVWAALAHGHWGPKLHRSADGGATFAETACPAFPADTGGAAVRRIDCLATGHDGRFFAGAAPGALFESRDAGTTWSLDRALWQRRLDDSWAPGGGGLMLHSVEPHPADPDRWHIAVSCGGVYETANGGESWRPRNRGVRADFLPESRPESGQDPYRLQRHPAAPDVLWQSNHCGLYRSVDGGASWIDRSHNMRLPFSFALALDPADPNAAWTAPISSDACRVAPDGALVVCHTRDGGESWSELRDGLPQQHCYDIVFRHALAASHDIVLFGTNTGSVYALRRNTPGWETVATHLPPVVAVGLCDVD